MATIRILKTVPRVILLSMFAKFAIADELLPILADRRFQSVILPAEIARNEGPVSSWFSEFWTPTPELVTKADKRIAEFLAAAPTNTSLYPSQRKLATPIRDNPASYIRQYVGIVRNE